MDGRSGPGLEWMLDADVVIAAESSRFKLLEASLGVFVTGGLTASLPAFAGLTRAKGLMLLGEEFGAVEAQAWGLAWKVVPDADLDSASARISEKLAALAPQVVSRYKKVLNEIGLPQFRRALEAESQAQRAIQG